MARGSASIDEKIENQKAIVSKTKDRYEKELEKLNTLMKKRNELRSRELMKAMNNVVIKHNES
jgi:hemin uptake protein HemP